MTRAEDEALDKFIDEQLLKGYIEPSKSPYASPFFFVKKKDGKLRLVQDYRALNSWMVKNQYPLPLIPVLIRDLGGAFMYSKLDVRWGYNNIRIRVGDELLRHGRDVHPTWVEGRVPCVILTSTGVRFVRLRSEEGLR